MIDNEDYIVSFGFLKMTVNDYKETACATAGPVEDMEVESDSVLQTGPVAPQDNENLLGRVLAGINFFSSYQ